MGVFMIIMLAKLLMIPLQDIMDSLEVVVTLDQTLVKITLLPLLQTLEIIEKILSMFLKILRLLFTLKQLLLLRLVNSQKALISNSKVRMVFWRISVVLYFKAVLIYFWITCALDSSQVLIKLLFVLFVLHSSVCSKLCSCSLLQREPMSSSKRTIKIEDDFIWKIRLR